MKVYGGDLVRAGDVIGRVKRTRVTFTVVEEGSETTYLLACPAWASGGEVWVNELEVTAVIEHGPHDYWQSRKGEGKRGHCRRCGIAKRDHYQFTRPPRPGEAWGSPLDDLFIKTPATDPGDEDLAAELVRRQLAIERLSARLDAMEAAALAEAQDE